MKLYHGTSERHLPAILANGLAPRKVTQVSNWKHSVESNEKAVYLTNAYALHYAQQAAEDGERLCVLEIDTEMLSFLKLGVDEDAVEQYFRGKDGLPAKWGMERRTSYYRRRLLEYNWEASLQLLGNCTYVGTIPVKAITRVALMDQKTHGQMIWRGCDPTITLINYMIAGERYRGVMKWLFDPDAISNEVQPVGQFEVCKYPLPDSRAGITVGTPDLFTGNSLVTRPSTEISHATM